MTTPDPSAQTVGARKLALRRAAVTGRGALSNPAAAAAVAARTIALLGPFAAPKTIAGYATIGDELDALPTLAAIAAAGGTVVLPVAGARGDRLVFRRWSPGAALIPGPFGTAHPLPGADVSEPDILLVPLLAFDVAGRRLGYGAGYYDRTLADLRARRAVTAIGLAYDGQEVAEVPSEPTDQPLDAVVTETRTLICSHPFPLSV